MKTDDQRLSPARVVSTTHSRFAAIPVTARRFKSSRSVLLEAAVV